MKLIRQILAFASLVRMLWAMAATMALTDTGVKSTVNAKSIDALWNEINHITGLGLPSPGTPGGGPLTYSPSYESQMSSCLQNLIDKLHNAGIL